MRSASKDFQHFQSLWQSLINEDKFVHEAGLPVVMVACEGLPLSFEPPAYGIDPKAVRYWPGYSSTVRKAVRNIAKDRKVQSIPKTTNPAKRPAESSAKPTDAKKSKVMQAAPLTGESTSKHAIKQEDGPDFRTTNYSAWKQTKEGQKLEVRR
ncbi:hypothetical protein HDK77DRAFT_279185 [Phyllosticta capitalensis]|uniref:uncharacterized protein n=1 Tax=Phyllosticta capitalensis TaxID=121624 RepID=UPI0031305AF5